MEELQQFLEGKVKVRSGFVERHLEPNERNFNTFIKDFETYAKALIRAKKTGNYKPVLSKKAKVRESIKENTRPIEDVEKNKNFCYNNTDIIKIKTEKLSNVVPITNNADSEEMPAPKMPPPKRKVKKEKESINVKTARGRDNSESKRSTRSNAPKADRNSDVILQNTPIPMVNLSDSDEEKQPEPVRSTRTRTKKTELLEESAATAVRSTRTRTKNKLQLEKESVAASANMNETESVSTSRDEVEESFNLKNVNNKTTDLKKRIEVSDQPVRMTRLKTEAKPKRERSQSEDNKYSNHKRSKSNTRSDNEEALNMSGRTEYEDAVSEVETCQNATFILPSKPTKDSRKEAPYRKIVDETVILDNQNPSQLHLNNHVGDILTDDESLEEVRTVSPPKSKKAKEVFSPYVRSPVKKKVEAFEKFNQHDAPEVSSKANTSRVLREIEEKKGNVKEKAKGFTPISSKTLYKNGPLSSTKIGKYVGNKSQLLNDSMSLFAKSTPLKGSAVMKPTSVDYREKEIKRQERDRELKRQELMKQAASADKKKKYEEKLLKVQQQKDALEKEKLKVLEAQRLKDERYKFLLQQKEEKQRQLKEENERKRLLAKQRAEEKRKEEEYQRMLAHQEKLKNEQLMKKKAEAGEDLRKKALQASANTTPIYMTRPAPYLQCDDCYDSDDEEYSAKRKIPDWATKYRKFEVDKTQTILGHRIKNTFFCCQNHTVDLKDIFEKIDPKKLKRTSSANWKKPPRFTMLPDCQ